MTTLVVGASGVTGKHLVEQLLDKGEKVKVIIRPSSNIAEIWNKNDSLTIIKAEITQINAEQMAGYLQDCHAVACCLGHNMTLKGIYGKPRELVAGSVRLLCEAIKKISPQKPIRFVLMNTAGNRNRDLNESVGFGEKMVLGLVRLLLPPHPDNEKAAEFLRLQIGQKNPFILWVVVRPDTLIDRQAVSLYELHLSPTRSAIFNPGITSRINVGHWMAKLITNSEIWDQWEGRMPVIYNARD